VGGKKKKKKKGEARANFSTYHRLARRGEEEGRKDWERERRGKKTLGIV